MKIILSILIALTSLGLSDLLTTEKLFELRRISNFHVSPNGNKLALVVSDVNVEENGSRSQIYLIDINSKDTLQLTTNGYHNGSPVWIPNSNKLLFTSDRSGSNQVWEIDLSGGEAKQITDFDQSISNLKISPKGKYLAFTMEFQIDSNQVELNTDLDKVNAHIYDELMARHWDTYRDSKWRHIVIMDRETGDTTDIMPGEKYDAPLSPFGRKSQFEFSPDESELAYTCKKHLPKTYTFNTNSDIYIYNLSSKQTKNITDGMVGYDMDPRYSPDGKLIAFHSMERAGYESDKNRIMTYNRANNEIKYLSKNLDQPASKTKWIDDNHLIFMAPSGKGTNTLYQIDLGGHYNIVLESDEPFDFGLRGWDYYNNTLVYSKENFASVPELFSTSLNDGTEQQISFFNTDVWKTYDKPSIEARWIKSTDGKKVHTWVVYPPNFDKTKKYPVLSYCQGGPQQQISQYFSYGWSYMHFASQGYIVVAPNRRGCPGFGQEWTDAIGKDYGGMPATDIMEATKAIATEPWADENRIAAVGASAGGYMAFWLAGNHNGLYNAFISHCGLFNLISMYGATEELFFPSYDNGGAYWENRKYYDKNSPHNFIDNWTEPILIITGELDYRVPYTQSLEAFTAARSKNIPARLLVFPQENHWVLKPQEKVLWYREFFRFLEEYNK